MRLIALIDDPAVVRRIPEHVGRYAPDLEPLIKFPADLAEPPRPKNVVRFSKAG